MKVLIADDNEDYRKKLKDALEGEGFIIEVASNGSEALKILLDNKFDCILSDVNMPIMDGFAFLEKFRKKDTTTQFILYTSGFDYGLISLAIRNGANYFLSQVDLKELKDKVNTIATTLASENTKSINKM